MPSLNHVVEHLDHVLLLSSVPDYPGAQNGLQAENAGVVTKVAAAVDASEAAIGAAVAAGADLLIVHHGLFWGPTIPWTGRRMRKMRAIVDGGLAVYAAHLPLDAHPQFGNNACLLRALDLEPEGQFGVYEGVPIGWWGAADTTREAFLARLTEVVSEKPRPFFFGSEMVRKIGVVTGGGGSMIAEAKEAGVDLFVTGEGAHHTYFDAEELKLNVVYAGHYATETFGVKKAAEVVSETFDVPWEFLDLPTGL